MLILAYILTFAIVLICAVASKGVTLFIISQVRENNLGFKQFQDPRYPLSYQWINYFICAHSSVTRN